MGRCCGAEPDEWQALLVFFGGPRVLLAMVVSAAQNTPSRNDSKGILYSSSLGLLLLRLRIVMSTFPSDGCGEGELLVGSPAMVDTSHALSSLLLLRRVLSEKRPAKRWSVRAKGR